MPLIETFSTDRLIADRLRTEDFPELCRMHQDPKVMATLMVNGSVLSDNETRQFLDRNLEHWEANGYGLWVFRDKVNGQFVGRSGLKNYKLDGKIEVELAYALPAEFWGKGLATEMAQAILKISFEQLDMADVVGFTLPKNQASQRVLEKVGFKYQRQILHAGLPHLFYRIKLEEYSKGL